jgi:hypothetical protein
MSKYKYLLNKRSGQFNLVPTNTVISFKEGVATEESLPSSGNTEGDARITNDTGHLYVWDGSVWTDQGDVIDLTWDAISGKPDSSVEEIDDAVEVSHAPGSDDQSADEVLTDETGKTVQDKIDDLDLVKHDGTIQADKYIVTNPQSDSYVLVLSDDGKLIDMNKSSAMTLTIPKNSSVAFPIGTSIAVRQKGLGQITIIPIDGDVTINNPNGLTTVKQYTTVILLKIDTNVWTITGILDLTQDDVGDGVTYKQYSQTEKNKLAGIEALAVALATVKADSQVASAISSKHTQGTDQGLDTGGVNAVVVADVKDAVSKKHSPGSDNQTASEVLTVETGVSVQDKIDDLESNKQDSLGFTPEDSSKKGDLNGYASLDGSGKIPVTELPNAIMTYQGTWNANTNTPAIEDGMTGATAGDVYRVSVAGTQDLGSGNISFEIGDYCIYNGSTWEKADTTDAVSQINGKTGEVDLVASDIPTDETGITVQDALDEKEPANVNIQNHIASTSDPHKNSRVFIFKVLVDDESLTTGDGKFRFTIPSALNGMNLIEAHAHVYTVSGTGLPSIAIFNETTSHDMLSVNITIDVNENDSKDAQTQPTINTSYDDVATGNVIRMDVDGAGDGTKGLEIRLTFKTP